MTGLPTHLIFNVYGDFALEDLIDVVLPPTSTRGDILFPGLFLFEYILWFEILLFSNSQSLTEQTRLVPSRPHLLRLLRFWLEGRFAN